MFLINAHHTAWPKILISIDPAHPVCPFSTHHFPPLPAGMKVSLSSSNLSLELLLKECVSVRCHTILKEIQTFLVGTIWENNGNYYNNNTGIII